MKNYYDHIRSVPKGLVSKRGCSLPLAAALAAVSGQAATLTWDSDANFANGSTDGSGTWNTALLNWNSGAADVAWPNTTADIAVFGAGGTAGTVTVDGTVNVGTITFNAGVTGSYLLTGGTLNGVGTINVASGLSARIDSIIASSGTINARGGGTLTLGGTSANTGALNLQNSGNTTVILAKTDGVNAVSGNIFLGPTSHYNSGGTLRLGASDQIADTSVVTLYARHYSGSGVFSLMGFNETIGGLVEGPGSAGGGGGQGVVQNGAATDSTLTLNVATGQTYSMSHGENRNNKTVMQNGGAGKLNVIKTGPGTQVFGQGTFTYTGSTTVDQGILRISLANGGGGTFNTSPIILAGSGTLDLDRALSVNAAVSGGGAGQVTVTGGGTSSVGGGNKSYTVDTVLSGNSTLLQTAANSLSSASLHSIAGGSTLNTGNFAASVKALTGAGTVNLNGAAALLTVSDGAGQNFTGTLTGAGGLAKSGAGLQELSGTLSYTGATAINGGTLHLSGTSALGAGNYGQAIVNTGTLRYSSSANQILSGNISGAGGALVKDTGAGTLTLSGNNSYTGGTTVDAGLLVATSGSALGTNSGLTVGAGTFVYKAAAAGPLTLGSGVINLAAGSRIGASVGGTLGQSAITSTAVAVTTGAITVDIYGIPAAPATFGVNNLITAAGGLDGATYTLGNVYNATNFSVVPGSLAFNGTAVSINVTSLAALADEYWKGGYSGGNNVWAISDGATASNWASDLAGTVTSQTPAATTTVRFSSTGATNQGAMILGGEMSVAGVVIEDGAAINLNADGFALTVGSGGVTLGAASGATSLNAAIKLGAAQAWTNDGANLLTVSGGVTTGGFTLTSGGAGDTTISGALSGAGGITKSGAGTLTLSGLNTSTGTTLVTDGTLALGHVSALATGTLDTGTSGAQQVTFTVPGINTYHLGALAGSDDLDLVDNTVSIGANGASTTYAGAFGGFGGSVVKVGAGTLTLTGPNTYTGTTTVTAGVLNLASAGVAVPGAFVMNGPDGTYTRMQQPGQFDPGTVANFTSASGAWNRFELLGKDQILAGINTGNSGTQGGGVIQNSEANGAAGANATLTLNGSGTYLFNGHLRDFGSTNAGTNKLNLIKDGTGTQTLQGGVISYSGTTVVSAGILRLVDTSSFKSAIANNATVELSAGGTGVYLGAGAHLSGGGTWNKTGAGIARINGGQNITTSGQINIQQGTLQNDFNLVNWSGNTANVNISAGAILDLYADAVYVNALTGAGFVQNNYGNSTGQSGQDAFFEKLVLGAGGGSGTFSGVIRNNSTNAALGAGAGKGGIQVEKIGGGTQTLSGVNTYTGVTTVSAGRLFVTGTGSTSAAGLIEVFSGATLGGGGTVGDAMFAGDANFSPGDEDLLGDHVMALTSLTLADTTVLKYELHHPSLDPQVVGTSNDSVVVSGALFLDGLLQVGNRANHASPYDFTTAQDGDKWLLMRFTPGNLTDNLLAVDEGNSASLAPGLKFQISTDASFGGVYLDVVAVPEAESGVLAALGCLLLLIRRKMRAADRPTGN